MDCRGRIARFAPLCAAGAVMLMGTEAAAERVVYINLDPVAINADADNDPTMNSYSSNGFTAGTTSGFALDADERTLLEFYLKEAGAPFDMHIVFERPAAGSYDMVVFGSATDAAALFADNDCPQAIGLADCGDSSGQNISFVFQGCLPAAQQTDMRRIAFYSLTGLGFGWGLENETSAGQIMGSYSVFGLEFGAACVPVSGATCPEHPGCPAGQQNATADLNAIIGARVDDGPPVVSITTPVDGSMVGDTFSVAADVDDRFGGLNVQLEASILGQRLLEVRDEPPYSWDLAGVPAGTWTFDVTVTDADANTVTASVTVDVAGDGPVTTTGGVGSTGGDGSTGDPTGDPTTGDDSTTSGDPPAVDDSTSTGEPSEEGGDSGGPIDPTAPVDPSEFGVGGTGCQCSNTTGGRGGLDWALALIVAGFIRRGRRSTRPSPTSKSRARTSP